MPVASLAAVIFAVVCPERTRAERLEEQKLSDLDWKGSLLVAATCGFLAFGLQQAALKAPTWSSFLTSVPLRTGVVCGTLLLARQYTVTKRYDRPMAHVLPIRIITDPILLAQIFLSLLAGCSYTFLTVMLPMRFDVVNFLTASEIFVHVAPFTIAFAAGTSICGFLLKHRRIAILGLHSAWLLVSVGNGLLMTIAEDYDVDPNIFMYMVLSGMGTGIACASCTFGGRIAIEKSHSCVDWLTPDSHPLLPTSRHRNGTRAHCASPYARRRVYHGKFYRHTRSPTCFPSA